MGTRVSVSADAPWSESVYKLVEVEGRPVFKTSKGKESSPYQKDVYRKFDDAGSYIGDVVSPIGNMPPYTEHKSLLEIKVASGRRVSLNVQLSYLDPVICRRSECSLPGLRNYSILISIQSRPFIRTQLETRGS